MSYNLAVPVQFNNEEGSGMVAKISGLLGIRARRDNISGFRLYAKLHSVASCIDKPMTKAKGVSLASITGDITHCKQFSTSM
jgi:hypothetical protein